MTKLQKPLRAAHDTMLELASESVKCHRHLACGPNENPRQDACLGLGFGQFVCAEGEESPSPVRRAGNRIVEMMRPERAAIHTLFAMPQSLSSILTHLVFSTKNRVPFLSGPVATEVHPYFVGILSQINCPPIQVGGTPDHVHVFFRLARTKTIAEVVGTLKTSSSKWIKTKDRDLAEFHWQSGYGAFSVSQSDSDVVVSYIRNQAEHHRKLSFQEEYRRFLERYQITYDERYVWD